MDVLFTGRRAYSGGGGGGGGAVADPDLQIRGGAVIQSLRKRVRQFQKKFGGGGWGNAKLRVSIRSDLEPRVVRIRTCGYWEAC